MNLNSNNTSSYNGSGTTWFDVTSNNYDWTLVNGPTWNGSAPKHFSFDGSNDWATNSFTVSSSTDCTWMVLYIDRIMHLRMVSVHYLVLDMDQLVDKYSWF